MLTQRDMDAGMAAARKVVSPPVIPDEMLHRAVAAIILAVDAERSPVAITKDVLGTLFAPKLGVGG